jgi:pimeloyl-ACP methyl ester carboxylesterase
VGVAEALLHEVERDQGGDAGNCNRLTAPRPVAMTAPAGDRVVLLHGIARSQAAMARLSRRLTQAGYQVRNAGYPSRSGTLEYLADRVWFDTAAFIEQSVGHTHFVTHSMGGLLARVIMARHRPRRLGRVVMLGPPSHGSEIADRLVANPLYRWYFGPAGAELGTRPAAQLQALLGTVDYPLGIIAGDRAIDLLGWLMIPGPNDGRVAVARTTIAGAADHLTLHVTHTFMMRNPSVILQTIHFLRHGRFYPASSSTRPIA